jgi:F-type H+-transporting ATPase subunit b
MLDINGTVLVVFALVWILVLILSRVFFKPISRIRSEREARLTGDREETRRTLETYEKEVRAVEEGLAAARTEAARLKEAAEGEALEEKARLLQAVADERRVLVEKARADLAVEVERLKKELDARTAELAGELERKVSN